MAQQLFVAALQFLPWAFIAACITIGAFLLFKRLARTPLRAIFRRVPVTEVTGEDAEGGHADTHGMQRVLDWKSLTVMGIAAIIGTGIFVLPGTAAALHAGPAVILSFVLCFFLCVIVALCYAEFASMIRSSGSAFMYAYATLGEIVAWIIGWDLLLEYAFGASGVAVGWSAYYKSINHNLFGPGLFHNAGAGTLWLVYGGVAAAIALTVVGRNLLLKLVETRLQPWSQATPQPGILGWCLGKVRSGSYSFSKIALPVAPYLLGFIAVGYVGIPERFLHAPKDIPYLTLAFFGPLVVGLVFLRSRLNAFFEGSETVGSSIAKTAIKWSPLIAGVIGLSFLPSFDLPAMLVTLAVSQLLVRGVHHTAKASTIFVIIKLVVIVAFIALGIAHVNPANWSPLFPERVFLTPGPSDLWEAHWAYGWQGMLTGAAIVLFAFIGFDGVTTAASETKRPQRDVPIGILASLLICTVAYVLVAVVMTGCMHYSQLGGDETTGAAPIALVMQAIGLGSYSWLISLGAIAGITSALILSLYGQSRVQWSMASRGLVPQYMAKLDPKYGTPANAIQLWGWIAAVVAGLFSISELSELTNIGTLAAFILVMIGIVILRFKEPNRARGFYCPSVISSVVNFVMRTILRRKSFNLPWIPDLPVLGIIGCLAFMWALPDITKIRFVVWMVIGIGVYFAYGFTHSKLRNQQEPPAGGDKPVEPAGGDLPPTSGEQPPTSGEQPSATGEQPSGNAGDEPQVK